MIQANFSHHDLILLNPLFDSPLVDILTDLEHLRRYHLGDNGTPSYIFDQLKDIFHKVESLASARIEGNHTTLSDYVDNQLENEQPTDEILEIVNIERAMRYIEKVISEGTFITEVFIRELHTMAVDHLIREGDVTPGQYRHQQVRIANAQHLPPPAIQVASYMNELMTFVNKNDASKYDLMKVALAHHRFGWIHPFNNGNGRVVRLFTYALLIKYGFNVNASGGRLLNPTAVFCNDRMKYYEMLALADTGQREQWCIYVLKGILLELQKLETLNEYVWLTQHILTPALSTAIKRSRITSLEAKIISYGIEHKEFKAADVELLLDTKTSNQRTYQIRKLIEQHLIQAVPGKKRTYYIQFNHKKLLSGVIEALIAQELVPSTLIS